jgi:predicted DNA binding CopG/RHH family protein
LPVAKKTESKKRDRLITLRLSADEHKRFTAAAANMGLPVSNMIRMLVRVHEEDMNSSRPRSSKK